MIGREQFSHGTSLKFRYAQNGRDLLGLPKEKTSLWCSDEHDGRTRRPDNGRVAQLAEHSVHIREVAGAGPAAPTIERFWKKVRVGTTTECWPWIGAANEAGYGRFKLGRKLALAHRVAYEIAHGAIPIPKPSHAAILVLHSCDNPACCNPDHLRLGRHSDNNLDMYKRGRR